MTNIKPLRGKFLGKIIPEPNMFRGIHLAKTKKEIPHRVKILAVGESQIDRKGREIKPVASIGNLIWIKKYAGDPFDYEGEHLIFLKNDDIVGKI